MDHRPSIHPWHTHYETLLTHLKQEQIGIRLIFMLLYALVYGVGEMLLFMVVLGQTGFVLMTGTPHARLTRLGGQLSAFLYHIMLFLTYNTATRPFPFSPWPPSSNQDG
jgi:hypothetical protein